MDGHRRAPRQVERTRLRSDACWPLVAASQDRFGSVEPLVPRHASIPPGDPGISQRTQQIPAERARLARATEDDVERLVREPVLRPAIAQEPPQLGDFVRQRSCLRHAAEARDDPAQRSALRIHALVGRRLPTQTGALGRCTGVGGKTTSVWPGLKIAASSNICSAPHVSFSPSSHLC